MATYSDINPAWDRLHRERFVERIRSEARAIQDEIKLANSVQAANRSLTRSDALREAAAKIPNTPRTPHRKDT